MNTKKHTNTHKKKNDLIYFENTKNLQIITTTIITLFLTFINKKEKKYVRNI